jgi:hypothetical protein
VDGATVDVAGHLEVSATHAVPDLCISGGPDRPQVVSSRPSDAQGLEIRYATASSGDDSGEELAAKG